MPRRLALAVLLAVLALTPQNSSAGDWMRLRSANFAFEGDVGEQDLRAVAERLERFRTALGMIFPAEKLVTRSPVTVLVFDKAGDYRKVAPLLHGKPLDVAGHSTAGSFGDSIVISVPWREQAYRVAYGEYGFLLIANAVRDLPVWLREGLDEYDGAFELSRDGREAVLGSPLPAPAIRMLQARLLPVADVVAAGAHSPLVEGGRDEPLFYAESWLLVHYLLHGGPDRKAQFTDFIGRLVAGLPAATAFAEAFPHRDALDSELSSYINRAGLHASRVTFSSRVGGQGNSTMTRMSAAEVKASMALELVRQGRYGEARPHLDAAVAAAPQAASVQTALGLLLALEGKPFDGLPAARRGAELADGDPMAHFALGYVALECAGDTGPGAPGHREVAVRELRRAVEILPQFPTALAKLASAESASAAGLDAAERHIGEAMSLLPGREEYRLVAAEIYLLSRNEPKVQELLGPIAASSSNADHKARARQLLGKLALARAAQETRPSETSAGTPPSGAGADQPAGTPPTGPPSRYLPHSLKEGERAIEGTLTAISCTGGSITAVIEEGAAARRFWAPSFQRVDFATFREDVKAAVACGPQPPGMRVYVVWRDSWPTEPALPAGMDGRVVVVVFLPKSQ